MKLEAKATLNAEPEQGQHMSRPGPIYPPMNNITLADIDQNRLPPKDTCFECGKEFSFMEDRINDGGVGWSLFNFHPACFKKYQKRKAERLS